MSTSVKKAFFVSIPHSGERVPAETTWLAGLPEPILMCDVDRFVDQLYKPAIAALKLPHVLTEWHRYVVDLNRLKDDIDVDSVVGAPHPSGKFARGLHWIITTTGEKLMSQPMNMQLHEQLVAKYFEPFHQQVRAQYQNFAELGAKPIFHIDLHSMPSLGTKQHNDPGEYRADVVVSDCKGKSCSPWFKDLVIQSYESAGFNVRYNWPYLGGRVTETYGDPAKGREALQVEFNRALYMNEATKHLEPSHLAEIQRKLQAALTAVYAGLPAL
jgi:N-formylglutamate deformylase